MVPGDPTRLLRGFEIGSTEDPATAYELARDQFGLELSTPQLEGFRTSTRFAPLQNVSLVVSTTTQPVRLLTKSSAMLHLHLCQGGHCVLTAGGRRIEIREGQALVCSPGLPAQLDFSADYAELVLRIPPAMLKRMLAALLGFSPRWPIAFDPEIAADDPQFAGLRELLMMLATTLDPEFSVWPKPTLDQLEKACVVSLLYCGRHNYSHLLAPSATQTVPQMVRDAEHFAESHAESDIRVEQMAQAAGVSTSTLTRVFLKSRGYTPAAFAKRARLGHARILLQAGAASTVIGVALRCGFANASRFTQDYQQAFGETPAETLRHRRRRNARKLQEY